jgi:hypothetical protein
MEVGLKALRAGRRLHPGTLLVLISVRDSVRLKGLGKWKNPFTLWAIEPVTFRLVE